MADQHAADVATEAYDSDVHIALAETDVYLAEPVEPLSDAEFETEPGTEPYLAQTTSMAVTVVVPEVAGVTWASCDDGYTSSEEPPYTQLRECMDAINSGSEDECEILQWQAPVIKQPPLQPELFDFGLVPSSPDCGGAP